METAQTSGDNTLLDLLGMGLGPTPAVHQPHPPMETGLLDLLGDTTTQSPTVPTANTESKRTLMLYIFYHFNVYRYS